MLGGVTRHMLPHLPGVPHLHVNRPLKKCSPISTHLTPIVLISAEKMNIVHNGPTVQAVGENGDRLHLHVRV